MNSESVPSSSKDLVLNQLKDIQLRLDLLTKEKLAKSPHRLADSIYSLLSSCGTPLSKDRILTLLDGNKTDFAKTRKHLIAQGWMVDGPGSDLVPKKICVLGGNFFILTQKQIDDRLKLHVEKRREKQRKREIHSC